MSYHHPNELLINATEENNPQLNDRYMRYLPNDEINQTKRTNGFNIYNQYSFMRSDDRSNSGETMYKIKKHESYRNNRKKLKKLKLRRRHKSDDKNARKRGNVRKHSL
jgi:hypothetical protein